MPATGGTKNVGSSAAQSVTTRVLHGSDAAAPTMHTPSPVGQTGKVVASDGSVWTPTALSALLPDHDHSGSIYSASGGKFDLINLKSTGVLIHQVPQADGSDGIEWGTLKLNTTVVADDYVAQDYDDVIVCNKATTMTVTIPSASGSGTHYYIKNINTGAVTIVCAGIYDSIDGETTQVIYQWECIQVVDYDSGKWCII